MSLNETTDLESRRSSYAYRVVIFASILIGVFLIIKIVLSGFSLSNFENTILSVFAALGVTLFIIRDRYLGNQLKSLESKYLSIITPVIFCALARISQNVERRFKLTNIFLS